MIIPDEINRSNRRSISLSVLKNGSVVVKAPLKMTDADIGRFVESKQEWIQAKLTMVNNTLSRYKDVISYQKIMVYGSKYSVILADVKKIEMDDNCQIIFPKKVAPENRMKTLISWYKRFAKKVLQSRMNFIAEKIKLSPSAFKISDSRGRWGSCNSRGTICINFRVIMLPPAIIDYILVHELCHLIEMNHSTKFWGQVMSFYPQAKCARTNLKEFSFLLDLFRKK